MEIPLLRQHCCYVLLLPSDYFHYKQKHHVCDPSLRDCMSDYVQPSIFALCNNMFVEIVVLTISVVVWNLVMAQLLSFVLKTMCIFSI